MNALQRREVLGGIATLWLPACSPFVSRFRFRLAVDIGSPRGSFQGSSVWEAISRNQVKVGDGPSVGQTLRGEAVVIDLPGGPLFMLLDEWLPQRIMQQLIPFKGQKNYTTAAMDVLASPAWRGRETALQRKHYPRFVRFRDIRDPRTIEAVDPDNLAASFGSGVVLQRVTAIITDDQLTMGIIKRLPWISTYYDRRLSGDRFGGSKNGFPQQISAGAFSTEER